MYSTVSTFPADVNGLINSNLLTNVLLAIIFIKLSFLQLKVHSSAPVRHSAYQTEAMPTKKVRNMVAQCRTAARAAKSVRPVIGPLLHSNAVSKWISGLPDDNIVVFLKFILETVHKKS